jgi:hypothetical protein
VVDSGTYARQVVTSAAGQGIEGNAWDLNSGSTYTITARVYPINGTVKMQVTGTTAFDQTSSGTQRQVFKGDVLERMNPHF